MKPVYFPIVCAAVAHQNKGTITKLRIKKGVISIRLLDNPINDAILTKAFSFSRANDICIFQNTYIRNMVIKIQLPV